jgi:hypothetical protein
MEVLVFEGPRAEHRGEWADRMNRQNEAPPCACGCGQRVKARAKHRTVGLPRYVHGHHPNPLRRAFEDLRRRGYSFVSDVAKLLGVSATTLRRMEAQGLIPKARRVGYARGKEARVYTAAQLNAMARLRTTRATGG